MGRAFDEPDNRRHFFTRLAEDLVHLVLLIDDSFEILYANAAAREVGGYEPEELVGRNCIDFVHPDDLEVALSSMGDLDTSTQRQLSAVPIHVRFLRADGTYGPVEVRGSTFLDDPRIRGIAVKARRADTRTHVDEFLHLLVTTTEADANRVLREIAAAVHYEVRAAGVSVLYGWDGERFADDASFAVDAAALDLTRTSADPSAPWLVGASDDDDDNVVAVVEELAASPLLRSLRDTDLRACWAFPIDGGSAARRATILVWREVAGAPTFTVQLVLERYRRFVELAMQRWEQEHLLRYAAEHDQLTGLGNRAHLHRFGRDLEQRASQSGYAVLVIDLDGFKPVNDAHGHAVGDELLRVVAARLRGSARADDVIIRLGGDEFCIVSATTSEAADADRLAERVLAALSEPVLVAGLTVRVGASVGVAVGAANEDVDEAIRRADEAMYDAKRAGKGRVASATATA